MNKALIALIVIVVLAVGGWAIFGRGKSNSSSPSDNNSQSQNNANPSASNAPSDTSSDTPTSEGKVTIQNMMFTPPQITITKGSSVTWTNNDSIAHTVTDDLSDVGGPASESIEPGASYSFTFNKTGSFQYHCKIHSSMRGTIVVK